MCSAGEASDVRAAAPNLAGRSCPYNSHMTPLRLLPFAAADGPSNMAADEAMLEAAERGIASLRFYTWTAPTLSLGYFQPSTVRLGWSQLPWVRRSTGGGAIVHHRELTYALAVPAGSEWHTRESWICRFHRQIRDVLADAGVKVHTVICGEERKLGEGLCFLHQTPGDLLLGGSKIAGSAQRKRNGALLQHGSILLSRSEFAPMLVGIDDFAGFTLHGPERFAQVLAGTFSPEPGEWTAEECLRIAAIRELKYASPSWNDKR